jgi:hypothetical protein
MGRLVDASVCVVQVPSRQTLARALLVVFWVSFMLRWVRKTLFSNEYTGAMPNNGSSPAAGAGMMPPAPVPAAANGTSTNGTSPPAQASQAAIQISVAPAPGAAGGPSPAQAAAMQPAPPVKAVKWKW